MIKVTILGTGDPLGGPVLFEKSSLSRLRPSLLIEHKGKNILFDASPDVRQQLLRSKIDHLDAVFVTHHHFDHFWGIGDLAQLTWTKKNHFPIYVTSQTKKIVDESFSWIDLDFKIMSEPVIIDDIKITSFSISHSVDLFGFVIEIGKKKIIYAPDMLSVENPSQYADLLVIDGMYILGKYMEDEDHAGGEDLQKIIDSFHAKNVWLVGFSEHWNNLSAKNAEEKLENKYVIPNDFSIFELDN